MLSEAQIDQLANTLNTRIDIPLAGEGSEKTLLVNLLRQLNQRLMSGAGVELQAIVDTIADGSIDAGERARLQDRAVTILNQNLNLPVASEEMEASLLRPIVDVLVEQARQRLG